jgi:hypothetical protein
MLHSPLDLRQLLWSEFWHGPTQFGEGFSQAATMLQPVGGMGRIGDALGRRLGTIITYRAGAAKAPALQTGLRARNVAREALRPRSRAARRRSSSSQVPQYCRFAGQLMIGSGPRHAVEPGRDFRWRRLRAVSGRGKVLVARRADQRGDGVVEIGDAIGRFDHRCHAADLGHISFGAAPSSPLPVPVGRPTRELGLRKLFGYEQGPELAVHDSE